MATAAPALITPSDRSAISPALLNACFVLCTINAIFFPIAWFSHWWIYDPTDLGIPTDFVNVWAAGKLVLDRTPALAYDWDIQKKVEVARPDVERTLRVERRSQAHAEDARGGERRRERRRHPARVAGARAEADASRLEDLHLVPVVPQCERTGEAHHPGSHDHHVEIIF